MQQPIGSILALGIGIYLALSGPLIAADRAGRWFVWIWIVTGVVLGAIEVIGRIKVAGRSQVRRSTIGVLAWIPLLSAFSSHAVSARIFNSCDDAPGYLYLVDRLLKTGGLIDPFSQRRLATLGGGTALQALAAVPLSNSYVTLPDQVLGAAILTLFLARGSWRRRMIGTALGLIALLAPDAAGSAVNTTARLLPTAMLVAVAFESVRMRQAPTTRQRLVQLTVIAVEVAALTSIRPHFGLPAVILVGLVMLTVVGAQARLTSASAFGGSLLILIAPWTIGQFRSSATPFFPLVTGNYNTHWPGARSSDPITVLEVVRRTVTLLSWSHMLWALALFGASFLLLRPAHGDERHVWCCLAVGGLVTIAASVVTFPGSFIWDIARFTSPPLFAVVMFGAVTLLASATGVGGLTRRPPDARAAAVAVVGVALVAGLGPLDLTSALRTTLRGAYSAAVDRTTEPDQAVVYDQERWYASLNRALPDGASVIASVDWPGSLDLERVQVVTVDIPGSVSPPPHMPLAGKAPRATLAYLRSNDIDYIVGIDSSRSACLYNDALWRVNFLEPGPYQRWTPDVLAWLHFTEALGAAAPPGALTVSGPLFALDLRLVEPSALPPKPPNVEAGRKRP